MPQDFKPDRGQRRVAERTTREYARSHAERRLTAQRRHAQMERESLRQLRELDAAPMAR